VSAAIGATWLGASLTGDLKTPVLQSMLYATTILCAAHIAHLA
jgi:hypothetical protein